MQLKFVLHVIIYVATGFCVSAFPPNGESTTLSRTTITTSTTSSTPATPTSNAKSIITGKKSDSKLIRGIASFPNIRLSTPTHTVCMISDEMLQIPIRVKSSDVSGRGGSGKTRPQDVHHHHHHHGGKSPVLTASLTSFTDASVEPFRAKGETSNDVVEGQIIKDPSPETFGQIIKDPSPETLRQIIKDSSPETPRQISKIENVFFSRDRCGCDDEATPPFSVASIVQDLNQVLVTENEDDENNENGEESEDEEANFRTVGHIKIKARFVGVVFVFANVSTISSSSSAPSATKTFTPMLLFRLTVVHSFTLESLIAVLGWLYVFSWSVCFYPQIQRLWRTRSADGFSSDTLMMNLLDQSVMLVQTYALFLSPLMRKEYDQLHPNVPLPMRPNDVASITHNFLAVLILTILVSW